MWAVTSRQRTGNTRYCETKDEIRIPPTQLLASSLDPPLISQCCRHHCQLQAALGK